MNEPAVRLQGVNKYFGQSHVLQEITLEVAQGEVVVICGPSGSGKSTLLRCVNGLEPVASGRIVVGGIDITRPGAPLRKVRQDVGFVFQSFNIFDHLPVIENITLAPRVVLGLSKAEARQRALDLLARVGMSDKASAHASQLSGGQKQRLAIARALAMRPSLMLFDEPTSALDPEMIKEVLEVMTSLAADGMTMLVVTHEMKFAAQVGHRILFMDGGRVVEDAPPAEFFGNPRHARTREFLSRILH